MRNFDENRDDIITSKADASTSEHSEGQLEIDGPESSRRFSKSESERDGQAKVVVSLNVNFMRRHVTWKARKVRQE